MDERVWSLLRDIADVTLVGDPYGGQTVWRVQFSSRPGGPIYVPPLFVVEDEASGPLCVFSSLQEAREYQRGEGAF